MNFNVFQLLCWGHWCGLTQYTCIVLILCAMLANVPDFVPKKKIEDFATIHTYVYNTHLSVCYCHIILQKALAIDAL